MIPHEGAQQIPWEYFSEIPIQRHWDRVRKGIIADARDRVVRFETQREIFGDKSETIMSGWVSTTYEEKARFVDGEFEQVIDDASGRRGVSITFDNTEQSEVEGGVEEKALPVLLFAITVMTDLPEDGKKPADNTTIEIFFDEEGHIISAQPGPTSEESDEDISSSVEVQQVLRRMKVMDPARQTLNRRRTLAALFDAYSPGLSQEQPVDILSLLEFDGGEEEAVVSEQKEFPSQVYRGMDKAHLN